MTKRIPPCGNYGDINNDGYVTQADADMVAEHVVGVITLTSKQLARADIYGDGNITARNATLIAKYAAGVEGYDTFSVCEGYIEPTKDIPWLLIGAAIILLYLLTRG